MNLELRSAINRHSHQSGIAYSQSMKQDLLTRAKEMWDEGKDIEDILEVLGVPASARSIEP